MRGRATASADVLGVIPEGGRGKGEMFRGWGIFDYATYD